MRGGSGESKGVMDRLMQGSETAVADLVEIELEIEGTMAASDIVAKLSQLSTVTEVSVVDEAE